MIMLDPKPFADVLRALIKRDGRSVRNIGGAAHVDDTYLTHLLHGRRTPPQREIVSALAETLCRSEEEIADLLLAAGWLREAPASTVHVEWTRARPMAWCSRCDRRWRAHSAYGKTSCSRCVEREYAQRAERIAAFEPRTVQVEVTPRPPESCPSSRADRPRRGGWYCRGCRGAFHTDEMIRVHLEGYFCRACHRKKIDRLCGVEG